MQAGGNKEKQREQSKKIERNQAKAQQKGGGRGGKNKGMMMDDDTNDAVAKPRKWNDYSVAFTFPEPPMVNNAQLLQLIDAHFKYPGREDFGMHDMNVGIGMGSRVRCCLRNLPAQGPPCPQRKVRAATGEKACRSALWGLMAVASPRS